MLVLIAAATLALAEPSSFDAAVRPFLHDLRQQCPAKRLDLMSPADLDDELTAFARTLPPRHRRIVAAAASKPCLSQGGLSCDNTHRLAAIRKLGQERAAGAYLCRRPIACTSQSNCNKAIAGR